MRQIDGFYRLPTATLKKLLQQHLRKAANSAYIPTARMRTIGNLRTVIRTRIQTTENGTRYV